MARSDGEMDFLRHASSIVQNYDEEGEALVPMKAWPAILDEMGLREGSQKAYFLMDHLEQVSGGMLSYLPLLKALGVVVPDDIDGRHSGGDSNAEANGCGGGGDQPPPGYRGDARVRDSPDRNSERDAGYNRRDEEDYQDDRPPSPSNGSAVNQNYPPQGYDERLANTRSPPGGRNQDDPSARRNGPDAEATARLDRPGLDRMDRSATASTYSVTDTDVNDLEDEEGFWARRAGSIQQLYHLWDCTQLSNELFTVQLQQLLGSRVDITSEDSEFVRLTNKHRSARNMKFAHLMSALRHDAKSTFSRGVSRMGSSCAGSSYAGSQLGDGGYGSRGPGRLANVDYRKDLGQRGRASDVNYNDSVSEVGSEANSHAAGRPTQESTVNPVGPGGRRHGNFSDVGSNAGGSNAGGSTAGSQVGSRSAQMRSDYHSRDGSDGRRPDLFGRGGGGYGGADRGDTAARPPSAPSSEAPYAWQPQQHDDRPARSGGDEDGPPPQRRQAPPPASNFWAQEGRDDHEYRERFETGSHCGSEMSVADSQREAHLHRNRGGHGNILTWGDNSRDLTPERRRPGQQGRQMVEDNRVTGSRSEHSSRVLPIGR